MKQQTGTGFQTATQGWRGHLLAALSGGLITLSLAPFNLWPLGLLSCGLLTLLLDGLSPKQAAWRGWFYGAGLFGSGISWVYVSIHVYGYAPVPLALFITALFAGGLALLWAFNAYLYRRFNSSHPLANTVGFAALFVLGEWLRSWLLTGFPWLYLGYGHISSPLASWAPIGGVFAVSFLVALSGATIAQVIRSKRWISPRLLIVACIWLLGWGLQAIHWTTPTERPALKIAMVQANISQATKWNHDQYWPTLNLYNTMSKPLWQHNDIVIWPEAAIPSTYKNAKSFIEHMAKTAKQHNSSLITGLPSTSTKDGERRVHNSIIAVGNGEGFYHKQRLVPFGEYVPLEGLLRGLIRFFDLPMSAFSPGSPDQKLLTAAGITLAPLICYEVVYPELVSRSVPQADVLLTISNDAWFGDSIGPLQHLEMAQMRALETGRYLIRSTGSGVSAIVDERGQILKRGAQFKKEIIRGEVRAMQGATPFALTGSWPIISLCLLMSLYIYTPRRSKAA